MNKVILIGRLTRDVDIKYSQSAEPIAVANFNVAVNRKFKRDGEPDADFINCVAFGKTAENIQKYFFKGSRIGLVGRIQVENYTDKDGNKRTATKVIVEEFDFIDTKSDKQSSSNTNNSTPDYTVEEGIDDDGLPF